MRKTAMGLALLAAAPAMIAAAAQETPGPKASEAEIVRPPATPPPPMPISHHDRPPTPTIGTYFVGRFGAGCDGGTLADGRRYRDTVRRLEAGQRIGISLTSPDMAPVLQVLGPGETDAPLARLGASAGGERSIGELEVAETGDHVFRVIAPAAAEAGRWRVELSFDRPIGSVYFSDWFDWNVADRACS